MPCFNCAVSGLKCRDYSQDAAREKSNADDHGSARPFDPHSKVGPAFNRYGCVMCGSTVSMGKAIPRGSILTDAQNYMFSMRTDIGPQCFSCVESHNRASEKPSEPFAPEAGVQRVAWKDPLPPRPKRGLFEEFEAAKNRVSMEQWNKINYSTQSLGYLDSDDALKISEVSSSQSNQSKDVLWPSTDTLSIESAEPSTAAFDTDLWQIPPRRLSASSSPDSDMLVNLPSNAPQIPGKTPQVPQKPLAYRHSLAALSEAATSQKRDNNPYRGARYGVPIRQAWRDAAPFCAGPEERDYQGHLATGCLYQRVAARAIAARSTKCPIGTCMELEAHGRDPALRDYDSNRRRRRDLCQLDPAEPRKGHQRR